MPRREYTESRKAKQQLKELMPLVNPIYRQEAEEGTIELLPGKDPKYPVVRDSVTKNLLPGTGQYPAAPDMGDISRMTAHRRTNRYREAFEELMPAEAGATVRGSLAWLYDRAMQAAEGEPIRLRCEHEDCNKKHVVAFRADGNLIFKLLEMAIGSAPRHVDVEVNETQRMLSIILQKRVDAVPTFDSDDEEAARRRDEVERALNGDFRVLPDLDDGTTHPLGVADSPELDAVEGLSTPEVGETDS